MVHDVRRHGTNIGEVADEIAHGDYEVSLIGGRVFYLEQVHVHPLFRGQHLAGRLIAHALWLFIANASCATTNGWDSAGGRQRPRTRRRRW